MGTLMAMGVATLKVVLLFQCFTVCFWSRHIFFQITRVWVLQGITWDSGKGRAISGPFPLLYLMSDFIFQKNKIK